MSGLLFLTNEDFSIQRGTKGDILCHNISGFSLILFYSTHCEFCKALIPIFKRLPGTIGGCQFGMINVSTNKNTVEMSQNTISPIKYVPYIVLYINGKPFMSYKGPPDEQKIRSFVVDVANNVQKKQQFAVEKVQEDKEAGGGTSIPAYSIGVPVSGDKNNMVCYLNFTESYKTGQQK